jgi:hypothetical protein
MPDITVLENGNVLVSIPITLRESAGRKQIITDQKKFKAENDPIVLNIARGSHRQGCSSAAATHWQIGLIGLIFDNRSGTRITGGSAIVWEYFENTENRCTACLCRWEVLLITNCGARIVGKNTVEVLW